MPIFDILLSTSKPNQEERCNCISKGEPSKEQNFIQSRTLVNLDWFWLKGITLEFNLSFGNMIQKPCKKIGLNVWQKVNLLKILNQFTVSKI